MLSRNASNGSEFEFRADTPFTTQRLLLGAFHAGELAIRSATMPTRQGWIAPTGMVLHPKEMVEGGLSEVEERALLEAAANAGSRKSVVHLGADLTDAEVLRRIAGA